MSGGLTNAIRAYQMDENRPLAHVKYASCATYTVAIGIPNSPHARRRVYRSRNFLRQTVAVEIQTVTFALLSTSITASNPKTLCH